ncbi:uncharacterized protein LOC135938982 isoform X1 [Cloeon dipterum]|uniref:uncharacterized protein LOC135938982 isoform X1 n=1 Tax=Cloeon dipterum TaxID=197152 RepID=UPI0032203082
MGSTSHGDQTGEPLGRGGLPGRHSSLQQGESGGCCQGHSTSSAAHSNCGAVQVEDKYLAVGRADYPGGSLKYRLCEDQSHSPTKRGVQRHDVSVTPLHECPSHEGAGNGSRRRIPQSFPRSEESASMPDSPWGPSDQCDSAESPVVPVVVADHQADLAYLDLARSHQQGGGRKVQAEGSSRGDAGRNDWRVPCPEQSFCSRKRSFLSALSCSGSAAKWEYSVSGSRRCGNRPCPGNKRQLGQSRRSNHSEHHGTSSTIEDKQGHQIHHESVCNWSGCVGSVQTPSCSQDHSFSEVINSDTKDDYVHEDIRLVYTPVNVPGPGCPPDIFDEVIACGCLCQDTCSSLNSQCLCVSRHGPNYSNDGAILNYQDPIFECNLSCKCKSSECKNRVVQSGPAYGLQVFETGFKGRGLRTSRHIPKDHFICEYAGEILGPAEASRRAIAQGPGSNYILVVREHSEGASTVITTIVDPTCVGNIGRYANHSCDPSAVMVPVRSSSLVPHLALFAARDLDAGEEVTFDYAGGDKMPSLSTTPCQCASGKCRSFLPWDPCLL